MTAGTEENRNEHGSSGFPLVELYEAIFRRVGEEARKKFIGALLERLEKVQRVVQKMQKYLWDEMTPDEREVVHEMLLSYVAVQMEKLLEGGEES